MITWSKYAQFLPGTDTRLAFAINALFSAEENGERLVSTYMDYMYLSRTDDDTHVKMVTGSLHMWL